MVTVLPGPRRPSGVGTVYQGLASCATSGSAGQEDVFGTHSDQWSRTSCWPWPLGGVCQGRNPARASAFIASWGGEERCGSGEYRGWLAKGVYLSATKPLSLSSACQRNVLPPSYFGSFQPLSSLTPSCPPPSSFLPIRSDQEGNPLPPYF